MRTHASLAAIVGLLALTAGCGAAGATGAGDHDDDAPAVTSAAPASSAAPTTALGEPASSDDSSSAPESSVPSDAPGSSAVPEPPAPGEEHPPGWVDVELTADERAAADTPMAHAVVAAFPAGFAPPTDEQGRCISGKIVNEIGEERLAELGVTPESTSIFGQTAFTDAEVDTMVDVLFECVDIAPLIASSFGTGLTPATVDCYAGYFDEQVLRDLAAPFLAGAPLDAGKFLEQVQAANEICL